MTQGEDSSSKPGRTSVRACGGTGLTRRAFLRAAAAGAVASAFRVGRATADTAVSHFVPADKGLSPAWIRALTERGAKEVFDKAESAYIGMPVGGIGAGQLYLCGDGTLGCWELFNRHRYRGTGERNYAGRVPDRPVDQGFVVGVEVDGAVAVRGLNRDEFDSVTFDGTYPIARVAYRDSGFPLEVELEAFSPFIPLNAKDSALPATVFTVRLKNASAGPIRAFAGGWLENAVCQRSAEDVGGTRRTRVLNEGHCTILTHGAEAAAIGAPAADSPPGRPSIVLQDFEGKDYGAWKVSGDAFGEGPAHGALPWQSPVAGFEGGGLANSFLRADASMGTLTSPPFTIARKYINLLIGGGDFEFEETVSLVVEGKKAFTSTGANDERLRWETWNVEPFEGKEATIEISDARAYPLGHICVDHIEMSDTKRRVPDGPLTALPDYGSMALALAECAGEGEPVQGFADGLKAARNRFIHEADEAWPFPERRNGALVSPWFELAPGAERSVVFVMAWHFPNATQGHEYANRFPDAPAVARYVLDNFARLSGDTRRWRDAYYDSSLPYWLLDRLHSTVSTLATGTCQWWANGRFWAYEGVVSCPGTCTHVWNYAHAEARLFPELARSVREMQDFNSQGGGYHEATGLVGFRGDDQYAADGQCGTVLKTYREHLNSAQGDFLKRVWPRARKTLEYMLEHDGNDDGLIEDGQPNTYDISFQGANTFVGSLYLAALRAGEDMALEMGDTAFATRLRTVFERGSGRSVERLWNGAYFVQDVDLAKFPQSQYGDGCLSDQVFGQTWAHQLGLGPLYPERRVRDALDAVWKYNWAPDVGPQNAAHRPLRIFAEPGEAGLLTCTWPKRAYLDSAFPYRDEIWTGIEYQVAACMIAEGSVEQGLAICRGVHERYHPRKRNPYNEVECGDHYARALASWGVYTALCGFEYHGPKGHIGFAPRVTPERFRAGFTAAEGWGAYKQIRSAGEQRSTIEVLWGRLALDSITLELPAAIAPQDVEVRGPSGPLASRWKVENGRLAVHLERSILVMKGESVEIRAAIPV